ncbi:hypothetical protein LCGC14_1643690 [marine sediment metagenome]|uniref:Uncharacterized protein n=1 Tax=marine sediment metagenome TaxID=412755 RepID=A0A0F9KES3_9ZZZZ|nr:hypothetical protein [Phycisphaerales bacterium]
MAIKTMSAEDFRSQGYLQEVNRRFLHPLGLALSIVTDTDGPERFGGIWDYRDDPEGMLFGDSDLEEQEAKDKAIKVNAEFSEKEKVRTETVGGVVQLIPGVDDFILK